MNNVWNDKGLISTSPAGIKKRQGIFASTFENLD